MIAGNGSNKTKQGSSRVLTIYFMDESTKENSKFVRKYDSA